MEKRKKLIILGIVLGVLLISGITYAALSWASGKVNIGLTSNCFTIDYTKGNDINNATINLLNESDLISNNKFTIKEGMALTYANIGIKSSCTTKGYGSLYLNITSLSDAFTTGDSKGALKYAVLENTSSVDTISIDNLKEQSFNLVAMGRITETGQIKLLTEQLSNTSVNKYLIVVYIDNSLTGNDVIGATFSGTISADANQGKLPYQGLAKLIADDTFKSTSSVAYNSNITYQYDTTHNLMQDIVGNIRYYGAEPNNYIYFNCSDYENQSSSTCEIWRIIGVFDGKVKLIRSETIGTHSWDNKSTSTGAETDAGKNDWSDARLMKLLNPGYESETVGGSLYYNSESGNCYANSDNATKTCDFTSTGIKNDTTRNLISKTTYFLGTIRDNDIARGIRSPYLYVHERSTLVRSGRPTTWQGKIALPYPSDYVYAVDLEKCTAQENYFDSTCTSNNWMKLILNNDENSRAWLLNPYYMNNDGGFAAGVYIQGGIMRAFNVCDMDDVIPVLHLNPMLDIKSGTGSSSAPYQLSV